MSTCKVTRLAPGESRIPDNQKLTPTMRTGCQRESANDHPAERYMASAYYRPLAIPMPSWANGAEIMPPMEPELWSLENVAAFLVKVGVYRDEERELGG